MAHETEAMTKKATLDDTEAARLVELLGLINSARNPVLAALQTEAMCPPLSLADMRKSLRDAYRAAGGKRDDLDRDTALGSRRVLPYLLVHYGAHNLQKLALEALEAGDSPENVLKLLDRSRELTQIIERHFFGQRPPDDVANVIDIASRKNAQRKAS